MSDIDSVERLEAILGKTPPAVNLKVIDHVDASAARWLAASPLMFAGFGQGEAGIAITLGGGAAGFATAEPAILSIPLAAPADIKPAKMFADHVKLNKDKGLGARIAGAFVSVPGLMQRGLDKDYKDNLY